MHAVCCCIRLWVEAWNVVLHVVIFHCWIAVWVVWKWIVGNIEFMN